MMGLKQVDKFRKEPHRSEEHIYKRLLQIPGKLSELKKVKDF